MTTVGRSRRYRIILRGECGQLMAAVLDDLLIEPYRGWTAVMAVVHDESELYDLLSRLQDFALHVISLEELGADVLNPPASGRTAADLEPGGAAAASWLRRAVAHPATLTAAPGPAAEHTDQPGLDMRAHAMIGLAALVVGGEPGTAYIDHVVSSLGRGVTLDEIVGVLVTLLPTVGAARVTAFAAATLEASAA